MLLYIVTAYLVVMTLVGFILCAVDKSYAKRKGHRRIRERTLFLTAALGGSVGVWAGMYCFRHKTKHMSFVIGIPAILAAQIGIIILLVYFGII
ncbi:MAG: DUF1294 domain-containing protein [Oscillospiraceae bacterium]|nr:DUF1294 domain-containing protein [Oscillospiraceae bacterium]MBQ9938022.1 DUF1294 domain-containing protein [Oscillospiraceae bacterium]